MEAQRNSSTLVNYVTYRACSNLCVALPSAELVGERPKAEFTNGSVAHTHNYDRKGRFPIILLYSRQGATVTAGFGAICHSPKVGRDGRQSKVKKV